MAGFKYGVRDAVIAPWTSTGIYGSLIDLVAVNQVECRIRMVEAVLEGDDEEVDSFGKTVGGTVRVRFGDDAQHADVLEALLGITATTSNSHERVQMGDEDAAYFGLAWKVVHTDGSGETHMAALKAKLTGELVYSAAYGGYLIPEFTCRAVVDGNSKPIERIKYTTTTALALPLTY